MRKTLLITGASRGIGRATAIGAAARGWNVAFTYRQDEAAAQATLAEIEAHGVEALALRADVADEAEVVEVFRRTVERFGALDAFVNNAGIVDQAQPLVAMSAQRLRRMFDVNVYGAFLCAREAARQLSREGGGRGGAIVNVSSIAARLGSPNEYVDYAASKAALDTLTLGLAKELGPHGVRVNAVRPGVTLTDIHASGGQPGRAERLGATTPLGRAGAAEEIAAGILWLLSDEASYTTGTLLDIGGGR
ncbi:SDR family oxidoreductase [Pseudomonas oryzihabitans]|uniref:NAD(P)-dependent dehydrogenase (Short-subunit alcohol dehydrogenase family) n=1 Tax=Pseudomonas oryzihabitans TaxID=47885 RepID=A0AAJ2BNE9_9PSED|nr:SDR family oxidoreductase [Pseudomonas psychrotolerans]MDR6235570.1 NAD(P)-dependent dehydrogenase (short-subunit alcohol dehydrogenase family) [Pseudomonas psychrotolerans]MDR6355169.1 NAD(P)-dependent dehydrogenase (short-subunit alcohol dehydrogenase family) [Pseudomonas psychrotolerans]